MPTGVLMEISSRGIYIAIKEFKSRCNVQQYGNTHCMVSSELGTMNNHYCLTEGAYGGFSKGMNTLGIWAATQNSSPNTVEKRILQEEFQVYLTSGPGNPIQSTTSAQGRAGFQGARREPCVVSPESGCHRLSLVSETKKAALELGPVQTESQRMDQARMYETEPGWQVLASYPPNKEIIPRIYQLRNGRRSSTDNSQLKSYRKPADTWNNAPHQQPSGKDKWNPWWKWPLSD